MFVIVVRYVAAGPGVSVQPGFYYRGVYKPLLVSWIGGTAKCTYLDMTDRQEPPPLQVKFPGGYKSIKTSNSSFSSNSHFVF